jgi:hypothetical protein
VCTHNRLSPHLHHSHPAAAICLAQISLLTTFALILLLLLLLMMVRLQLVLLLLLLPSNLAPVSHASLAPNLTCTHTPPL